MNEQILEQLTRIANALELAILPQNNDAYAAKVKETLNVDDAKQELAPKTENVEEVKSDLTYPVYMHHAESESVFIAHNKDEVDSALQNMADIVPKDFYEKCKAKYENVEEVKELETQTYTHDDLKALCLSKSREDVANKPKLKALLKEFGAAKVLDVKSKEDLTTIITRINSGEF